MSERQPYEMPTPPGTMFKVTECNLRQLPTIEQLEPAAREYCRLLCIDPDSTVSGTPIWRLYAGNLREALATRWALDVYVSQNANGDKQ